jgi:hypothetical protein
MVLCKVYLDYLDVLTYDLETLAEICNLLFVFKLKTHLILILKAQDFGRLILSNYRVYRIFKLNSHK